MNIELRSLLKVATLPIILLLSAYYYIPLFTKPLPDVGHLSLPYIPFIFLVIGLILSWVFHNCRGFNLLLLFAIIYIALDKVLWHPVVKVDSQLAYLLLVALIPVNYLYNLLSRERGILSQYGIRRLIFLALQLGLIAWLLTYPYAPVKEILNTVYFKEKLLSQTAISQPLLIALGVIGLIYFIRLLQTADVLLAGILASLIAITSAIHFVHYPQVATMFIILAEILIIISITVNAYSLAYLDELTNLPSRRALMQNITTLGKRYTIAMVDVDHFKKFNDKYGHDVGDQVLKKLAGQLRNVRGGKPFRYGGEEFTILFPNKNIDEARLFCDNLCLNVANSPFMLRDKKRPKSKQDEPKQKVQQDKVTPLTTTISIGLAERSDEHPTASNVIKHADKALYKAKSNGRNQVATLP
jgi:diguanylate cyclase (GGDEF)-like protein